MGILQTFVKTVDDKITLYKRQENLPRWAEMCGVEDYEQIDMTNPYVRLEFLLCDVGILRSLSGGKGRDAFLKILSPEEQDIYLNTVDEDGARYTDLEDPKVMKDLQAKIKQARKEAKKQKKR